MVVFTVIRKGVLPFLLFFIFLVGVFSILLFSWRQPQTLRVGVQSPYSALANQLLSGFFGDDLSTMPLKDDGAELLARGELDFFISAEAIPGYDSLWTGDVIAAVVVNYFNSRENLCLEELKELAKSPERLVISQELALPGFSWLGSNMYLPTEEVIEKVAGDNSLLGLIPVQQRVPSLRVLPLDGMDPRLSGVLVSDYPLKCRMFLHKRRPSWRERIRDWVLGKGKADILADYLGSGDSLYLNQWLNQGKFGAVGDVMLDRDVKKEGLERGWEWIFEDSAPLLGSMDLAFCNLESPVGERGRFINMFQAPPESIAGLTSAGFDVVALANNHILDHHHEGMFETMEILENNDIVGVGAGGNIREARRPVIKVVNGITIGFVAYTEMWFVYAREPISWQATEEEPGVVPAQLDYVTEDISKLRDKVNVIIVSFHWGKEHSDEPTTKQIELARAAIDAGADLVLGHHPHVLQGIEFYKHGVVAYSLGNFVFDMGFPRTQDSMILEFTLSKKGVLDMDVHPVYIQGVQPVILSGGRKTYLYNRIKNLSQELE